MMVDYSKKEKSKKIDEIKNYFIEEIEQNNLMSKSTKMFVRL